MARDVFISYEKNDRAVAEGLCRKLEENGVRVWYAPRDIPAGADWALSIQHAIGACRLVVLIYSATTETSGFVQREVTRAASSNLPIVPFCLKPIPEDGPLGLMVATSHWLDASKPPLAPHYQKLVETVRAHLGPQSRAAEPARKGRRLLERTITRLIRDKPPFEGATAARSRARDYLLPATAAFAALAIVGGVALMSGAGAPPPPAPAPPSRTATSSNCALMLDAARKTYFESSLTISGSVQGKAEVLCLDVLNVGGKIIKLAGVGSEKVRAEQDLSNWILRNGGTVDCRASPEGSTKYRCHVGGDANQADVAQHVLERQWAARED
jgi:hypothetical protein